MPKAKLPFVPDPALDEILMAEIAEREAMIKGLDEVLEAWKVEWNETHPQATKPTPIDEICLADWSPTTPTADEQAICQILQAEWNAEHPPKRRGRPRNRSNV
jgi:hypothetical protein